jgi:hypothetical protein
MNKIYILKHAYFIEIIHFYLTVLLIHNEIR